MLSIPIPVMYRILNGYDLKINNLNENDSNRLLNFLFKYLRKNGKTASALFSTIDIQRSRIELIPTLLDEYSDVFDFNMINPELGIKTIRELLNEITKLKLDFSTKIEEMSRVINQQKEDYSNLSTQISNLSNLLNQQISCQRSNETRFSQIETRLNEQNGINQKVHNLEAKSNQQNQTIQSNENSLKTQIESSFNTEFASHQRLLERMDANINSMKSELTNQFDVKMVQINRSSI